MARARSADVPSFDSYPAADPMETSGSLHVKPDWPYGPRSDEHRSGNERLNQTAEQIGETLGRVVAMSRVARRRLDHVRAEAAETGTGLKQQLEAVSEAARERLDDLRSDAAGQINELLDKTQRGIACGRERARLRVLEAREQTQRYARENPLQVIAGALVAGLALGVGLRLWREHND